MSKSKSALIASINTFTHAYIECALWSSTDESNDSGGDPLDDTYTIDDITVATLRDMIDDCVAFQKANADDLATVGDDAQSGHDFWLTRNGHGAGFWDRGLGELGERLTKASKSYGSAYLQVHRGKVCS